LVNQLDADKNKNHTHFDVVRDIEQLANSLFIRNFSVIGLGSGANYALSCATFIPNRIKGIALIAPIIVSPNIDVKIVEFMAKHTSIILKIMYGILRWQVYSNPIVVIEGVYSPVLPQNNPLADAYKTILISDIKEAFWQGTDAVIEETARQSNWDYSSKITLDEIDIWYGELSQHTSPQQIQLLCEAIDCELHSFNETHYGPFLDHFEDILTSFSAIKIS